MSKKLNPKAVREADNAFYKDYPEMAGKKIHPTDPAHKEYRANWWSHYKKAKADSKSTGKKSKDTVQPCPLAEKTKATIKAKWSKSEITPNHNSQWPPKSPPTDTIPDEAKVQLIVDTTDVPDGTSATIEIRHCHTNAKIKNGVFSNLVVKGNKVIDPKGGKYGEPWKPPVWVFEAEHMPWDPWNKPFFYFMVTVNHGGLQTETPKDYRTREKECLRVIYWHALIADARADANDGLTTQKEISEIAEILCRVEHSKAIQRAFNQANVATNLWGSLIRNTYTYHHSSHGTIENRTTGAWLGPGHPNPPDDISPAKWRSVIVLGNSAFGEPQVKNAGGVPSTPRYLAYFNTCLAGWEPSFAKKFIGRGTQNVIAFRMSIPDGDARLMAWLFYRQWCNTYKCNPSKIKDVFLDVGPKFYSTMRPVLFGLGGTAVTADQDTVGKAIVKFFNKIHYAVWSWFN